VPHCGLCDYAPVTGTWEDVAQHVDAAHGGRAKGVECGTCFKPWIGATQHLNRHEREHDISTYLACALGECADDPRLFLQRSGLKAHQARAHGVGELRKVPCRVPGCGKTFASNADEARHHAGVHEGATPHACSFCGARFSQAGHRNTHQRACGAAAAAADSEDGQ
jgi:hypothetical protein